MVGYRRVASKLDMYRKVPIDLLEGTKRGSALSYVALIVIVTLFCLETKAFFFSRLVSDLSLDKSDDPRIRLNFNITMLDLKCEWATIDVVSVLGTDQNVTAHINKYGLDANGIRQQYRGKNRAQHDIDLFDESVSQTLEQLYENGEDAISLTEQTLEFAKQENDYVFVDFHASWCSHCRDLAPTWETLAELMADVGEKLQKHQDYTDQDFEEAKKVELPVMIAKIDCVNHQSTCLSQGIRAYPTLRLFVDGERWKGGDYRGHRTIIEMVEWLFFVEEQHKANMNEEERQLHIAHQAARERLTGEHDSEQAKLWHDKVIRDKKRAHHEWIEEDHPGCLLSGHLLLDRAPGNFHILARSQNQEFAAHMANVSHMVNTLMIGDPVAKHFIDTKKYNVPQEVANKVAPMDGNVYSTHDLHEAYHHYLKLVSTQVENFKVGQRYLRVYQIIGNSQLAYYRNDMDPEAKFVYDLSPIAVSYRSQSRRWYDYCTSIMAIIGGVFTVVGMIESSIAATVSKVKSRQQRPRM